VQAVTLQSSGNIIGATARRTQSDETNVTDTSHSKLESDASDFVDIST